MDFLPGFLRTPLAFIVVLGVLIFVHELGHYLAARWRGVHVEAFSIGFGRALVSWTDRRGTAWKVGWLPLGGYVKLHGQERPEDVSPEIRASWQPGRTFHEKSVGDRAIVVAAGPVANFLLAAVLFTVLFATVGRPVPVAVVGEVVAGGPAAAAGLRAGDRVDVIGVGDGRVVASDLIVMAVDQRPEDAGALGLTPAASSGVVVSVPVSHVGALTRAALGDTPMSGVHLALRPVSS